MVGSGEAARAGDGEVEEEGVEVGSDRHAVEGLGDGEIAGVALVGELGNGNACRVDRERNVVIRGKRPTRWCGELGDRAVGAVWQRWQIAVGEEAGCGSGGGDRVGVDGMGAGVRCATIDGEVERFGDVDRQAGSDLGVLNDHDLAGRVHDRNVGASIGDHGASCFDVDGSCSGREPWIGVLDDRARRAGREIRDVDRAAVTDRLIGKDQRRACEVAHARDVDGEHQSGHVEPGRSADHGLRDRQFGGVAFVYECGIDDGGRAGDYVDDRSGDVRPARWRSLLGDRTFSARWEEWGGWGCPGAGLAYGRNGLCSREQLGAIGCRADDVEVEGFIQVEVVSVGADRGLGDRKGAGGVGDPNALAALRNRGSAAGGGREARVRRLYSRTHSAGREVGDHERCVDRELAGDHVVRRGEAVAAGHGDVEEFSVEVGSGWNAVEGFRDGQRAGVAFVGKCCVSDCC